jgi:hypothetical protein
MWLETVGKRIHHVLIQMGLTTFLQSSIATGGSMQRYVYAFADGTSFTGIYNGKGCKMPILAMVSIAETGERDVLAFCVGDRENEQACNDLLADGGSCIRWTMCSPMSRRSSRSSSKQG